MEGAKQGLIGSGVGLRVPHYRYILEHLPKVSWFEAISENFMGIEQGSGGRPLHVLSEIRKNYPVALHGVSLSIGSVDPLNQKYLKRLKELIHRIQPLWVSDHFCWTGVRGKNRFFGPGKLSYRHARSARFNVCVDALSKGGKAIRPNPNPHRVGPRHSRVWDPSSGNKKGGKTSKKCFQASKNPPLRSFSVGLASRFCDRKTLAIVDWQSTQKPIC